MKNPARNLNIYLYGIFILFIAAVLALALSFVDRITSSTFLQHAEETRELEASIAATAMEESFSVTISQSNIIALFSFPEYFRGLRTEKSMTELLEREKLQMGNILVTAYMDSPDHIRFITPGSDSQSSKTALLGNAPRAWDALQASAGPLVLGEDGPPPFFIYYLPVRWKGRFMGLLATTVDFQGALKKYLRPDELRYRRTYLLDGADRILWASQPEDTGNVFDSKVSSDFRISGQEFRLGDAGFQVILADMGEASRLILQPVERIRNFVFLTGLALVAAVLAVILRLVNLESIRQAYIKSEQKLIEAVSTRERELAESELRYGTLFKSASDAILVIGRDGVIHRGNQKAAEVFGYSNEDLRGKTVHQLSVSSQGNARTDTAPDMAAALEEEHSNGLKPFEWKCLRADGREFLTEASLSFIESGGSEYGQIILRDVTERRRQMDLLNQSLEEREVLLKELHHRVKNNLQFIQSLISLQLDYEGEQAQLALKKTNGRISALTNAYLAIADRPENLLLELPAYLRNVCDSEEVESSRFGGNLSIDLSCDHIHINLDPAVSLGLILRELLENARTHGYGRGSSGRIEVRFTQTGNEASLSVRDFGRGIQNPASKGLGLRIVAALTNQLLGTLTVQDASPGTRTIIRFPQL